MNRERTREVYEQLIEQIGADALADGLARYFRADEVNGAVRFIAMNHDVSPEQIGADTLANGLARYFEADEVAGALQFIAMNHNVNPKRREA